MKNEIVFYAKYKNKSCEFSYGSEAYIFHTGIYNGIDRKYRLEALLKYVSPVHNAYLSGRNRTHLGALADYAAENWKEVRRLDGRGLLDRFYTTNFHED